MKRSLTFLALMLITAVPMLRAQDVSELSEKKPFTLSGSVGANASYQNQTYGLQNSPYNWTLFGSLNPAIYGFELPFSFTLGSQQSGYSQPFNQFGISPSYKWIKTHLGYRSMEFSRYSLAGITFFGAGVELTPGSFRLSAMTGRFQSAIEEDTTSGYNVPTYKRNGYGVMMGYGNEDTKVELSFFHASDDTTSLAHAPVKSTVLPAENSVLALNSAIPIIPGMLTLQAEGGVSVITRDVRADKFETTDIPEIAQDIQNVNITSGFAMAGTAGLNFTVPHFGLRLSYERIDPEYNSLGAYFTSTDLENWLISPSFDLMDGVIRVNGSLGIQNDNLMGTKEATTSRLIGSSAVSWNPSQTFGVDVNYANYSSGQGTAPQKIDDTTRKQDVSQSGMAGFRYAIVDKDVQHNFGLNGGLQSFTSTNIKTGVATHNNAQSIALSYNYADMKDKLNFGGSLLYSNNRTDQGTVSTMGLGANGSTTMIDDKLALNSALSLTNIRLATATNLLVLTESFGASYQLSEDDNISLSLSASQNVSGNDGMDGNASVSVGYGRTFNIFR